jgi:hypothetical protein
MFKNRLPRVFAVGLVALSLVLGPAATSSLAIPRPTVTTAGVRLPEATATDNVTVVQDPAHLVPFAYQIQSTPAPLRAPGQKKPVVGVNFPALSIHEISPGIGNLSSPAQIEMSYLVPNRGPSGVGGFQIDYQTEGGSTYRSTGLTAMKSGREGDFNTYFVQTKPSDFFLVDGAPEREQKIVALSVRYRPTTEAANTIYLQVIAVSVVVHGTKVDGVISGKFLTENDNQFRVK